MHGLVKRIGTIIGRLVYGLSCWVSWATGRTTTGRKKTCRRYLCKATCPNCPVCSSLPRHQVHAPFRPKARRREAGIAPNPQGEARLGFAPPARRFRGRHTTPWEDEQLVWSSSRTFAQALRGSGWHGAKRTFSPRVRGGLRRQIRREEEIAVHPITQSNQEYSRTPNRRNIAGTSNRRAALAGDR